MVNRTLLYSVLLIIAQLVQQSVELKCWHCVLGCTSNPTHDLVEPLAYGMGVKPLQVLFECTPPIASKVVDGRLVEIVIIEDSDSAGNGTVVCSHGTAQLFNLTMPFRGCAVSKRTSGCEPFSQNGRVGVATHCTTDGCNSDLLTSATCEDVDTLATAYVAPSTSTTVRTTVSIRTRVKTSLFIVGITLIAMYIASSLLVAWW